MVIGFVKAALSTLVIILIRFSIYYTLNMRKYHLIIANERNDQALAISSFSPNFRGIDFILMAIVIDLSILLQYLLSSSLNSGPLPRGALVAQASEGTGLPIAVLLLVVFIILLVVLLPLVSYAKDCLIRESYDKAESIESLCDEDDRKERESILGGTDGRKRRRIISLLGITLYVIVIFLLFAEV